MKSIPNDISINEEILIEFKKFLQDRLKEKKIQAMKDGPFPFRGFGLSGTISPGVTPFNFPFLD